MESGARWHGATVARAAIRVWRELVREGRTEREIARRVRQAKRKWLTDTKLELKQAVEDKDPASMWELTRRLAGTQRGPRKRRLNVPPAEVPSTGEWGEYLAKTGPEGGCRGTVVREGEVREVLPECTGFVRCDTGEVIQKVPKWVRRTWMPTASS